MLWFLITVLFFQIYIATRITFNFYLNVQIKFMPPDLHFDAMPGDIVIKGNLRKAKNWNKRFFVLRDSVPAKLEYYESERKWKANNSKPKRTISLEKPWNVDKKKGTKHEFLIAVFTEEEYFLMAADNTEMQENWVSALQKVVKQGR